MKGLSLGIRILFLLFLCATVWGYSQTVEEVVTKQLPLKKGGLVTLKNTNGKVEIEGWDKEELYMEAEKRVKAGSREKAEKVLAQVEILIDENADEISIEVREPQKGSGFWDWIFGDELSVNINYKLRVPQDCRLQIDNTNGSVEISAVEGDIHLETTNGKIVANNIGGTVEGHTTNGDIRSQISSIASTGSIQFTTTNGSIETSLPGNASFELRARTTNGSINTDFPLNISGKYIGSRVESSVNGGGPLVYLQTTNGSIDIHQQ